MHVKTQKHTTDSVPGSNTPTSDIQPGTVIFSGVSKRFRKHTSQRRSYTTLKSSLLQRFWSRPRDRASYIHALRKVTLSIPAGKALGVIGKNGSGKSTLLKLIAGIYRADRGAIKIHGKISALIELGAGFHPDFTGRENIYLGGVMFGLTRHEIDKKFDDIVRFAELEDFIDDPVRTYSSGMYMRLGFSLAIHTDPDVLLVDEVLAVGDASFIHRCQERISDFKRRGKTLIFVTHDLDSVVRWCDEVVWLHRGRVKDRGEPRRVVDHYLSAIAEDEKAQLSRDNEALEASELDVDDLERVPEEETFENPENQTRWGSQEVEITSVQMFGAQREQKWLFDSDERIEVRVNYEFKSEVKDLVFGIGLLRADGTVAFGTNTDIELIKVPLPDLSRAQGPVTGSFTLQFPRTGLVEDTYYLDVAAHRSDGAPYDYHHLLHKFSVRSGKRFHGVFRPENSWRFEVGYPVLEQRTEAVR